MDISKLIKDPEASVVDVRSKLEYMMGHSDGAVNIPLGQVQNRLNEFKTMSKPLILCCASGARSGQALGFLQQAGVKDVYNAGPWTNTRKA